MLLGQSKRNPQAHKKKNVNTFDVLCRADYPNLVARGLMLRNNSKEWTLTAPTDCRWWIMMKHAEITGRKCAEEQAETKNYENAHLARISPLFQKQRKREESAGKWISWRKMLKTFWKEQKGRFTEGEKKKRRKQFGVFCPAGSPQEFF